jgi:hypothetical protein
VGVRDPAGRHDLDPARRRPQPQRRPDRVTAARVDISHFGERLGLFVIIVLGEAVAQVVGVAADLTASRELWLVVLAGFGLLVCFWWLTLLYGAAATPVNTNLPPRVTLPMHFVMTGAIVAIAAGLGAMTEQADAAMPTGIRWVLCGGGAVYFLSTAVLGIASRAPRLWILGWPLRSSLVGWQRACSPPLTGKYSSRASPARPTPSRRPRVRRPAGRDPLPHKAVRDRATRRVDPI